MQMSKTVLSDIIVIGSFKLFQSEQNWKFSSLSHSSYTSSDQQLPAAGSYCTGQDRSRTFPSSQKDLLDSTSLERYKFIRVLGLAGEWGFGQRGAERDRKEIEDL